MNKVWFMVVAKNIFWNAMEMVRRNHRPYLLSIAKIGSSRICLQKHYKPELNYLKMCMDSLGNFDLFMEL
jgi:hypothetical protein